MARTAEAAVREELRRAGLSGPGSLARLLGLLRASAETHLGPTDIARLAAEGGLALIPAELARHLETLLAHGLLGRLPSTGPEPVFDTITSPHFHLVDEATAQTVDLEVSPETLLAILRQAMAERPGQVEVMVRLRQARATQE